MPAIYPSALTTIFARQPRPAVFLVGRQPIVRAYQLFALVDKFAKH